MIKSELLKMTKSYKFRVIFVIVMIFMLAEAIDAVIMSGPEPGKFYGNASPPFIAFLSDNTLIKYGMFFEWLMPVFLIIAYCDKYASETRCNAINVYLTRSSRKKYFLSKIITAFISPTVIFLIPLLINLAILIVFQYGGNEMFGAEQWTVEEIGGEWNYYCYHHPYFTYFLYMLFALIIYGLLAVFCQSVIIVLKDTKSSLIICFAVWMINHCFVYTIGTLTLPFDSDNPLPYSLITLPVFLPIVIIPLIIAYIVMVVNKDEV